MVRVLVARGVSPHWGERLSVSLPFPRPMHRASLSYPSTSSSRVLPLPASSTSVSRCFSTKDDIPVALRPYTAVVGARTGRAADERKSGSMCI